MTDCKIVFIAFKEFDNLGIGYIAAVLSDAGYEVTVIDFKQDKEDILGSLGSLRPLVVGFSIIFEFHFNEFRNLIKFLRDNGIDCHFTAGGHFASLRYRELFELIPSLNSIIRFDGENIMHELADCLAAGKDWKGIDGIVHKTNSDLIVNTPGKIENNLDNLPYPLRSTLREYIPGKKFATIIAGRGCVNNCSFCSIREYYSQSTGPLKRIRKPEGVVAEMEFLYKKYNCTVFLFQDDDFPVNTGKDVRWADEFCNELVKKKLCGKVIWKINCRPDEVDMKTFGMLKNHGLFLVYLGIEEGTSSGLKLMNKKLTPGQSTEGVNIIKKLEIGFDYGFMPFQPTSTFRTVRENFVYLREMCSDGYTPVLFSKMMPLCGTPLEKQLAREGKIRGIPGFLDYDFSVQPMNHYFDFVDKSFPEWLRDAHGLLNNLKWARNVTEALIQFYGLNTDLEKIKNELKTLIAESNIYFLDMLDELSVRFERGSFNEKDFSDSDRVRADIRSHHDDYNHRASMILKKLFIMSEFLRQTQHFSYIFERFQ